jgi:acyl phosphate:glycerol-3-phosphate acyltransferase
MRLMLASTYAGAVYVVIIIACYLIGAIPFCYIIGKLAGGKKLTEIGDKNPGGWNLIFNVSKFWGIIGTILDVTKGYFSFFLVFKFTGNLIVALIAGCASVAGHNYSPYLKFSGGKGIATMLGFLLAVQPLTVPSFAVGILFGLYVLRNMVWGVILGIVTATIFLGIYYPLTYYHEPLIYIALAVILILIMVPKQINRSIKLSKNFQFRKEATVKDLFTPKIR